MNAANRLLAIALSALVAIAGCQPAEPPADDPPVVETSAEPTETANDPPVQEPDPDEIGIDDDVPPKSRPNETPAPAIELPESLPTIDELPALSSEAPIDERTKLHFANVGQFKVRDGVYVLTLNTPDGSREIMMTVETQANGFVVRRGDQTSLRFVVDDQGVAFANEPGSGTIGGRGVASGDDWIRGAFRTKSDEGTSADGTFELRKLFDPKTPRSPNQP